MANRLGCWGVSVGLVVLALSAGSSWALHANEGAELPLAEVGGAALSIKGSLLGVGGEARELVYAGAAQSGVPSDYKISELVWDIESLTMAGGTVALQLGEKMRVNAGAWININEGDGGMEDYDWTNPRISWDYRSESEVDIEAAYSIDVNASLALFEMGPFMVSGLLGYKHDFWEWSDFGGTYVYSTDPNNGAAPYVFRGYPGSFGGENGIDYEQTFDVPYFGAQVVTAGARMRASAYLLYSPRVKAEDKDHHIMRNAYFREEFDGGDYIAAGVDITADLTDRFFLSGSIDAQVIPEITGDMYAKEGPDGEESKIPDGAGIENSVVAVALSAGMRL